ncbi:TPA: hypothetical protein HA278_06905 [Candidatus Woesearchaeota archaeon]|mgnify:CR=1 FL=1|nr:hypothetical protein [archaeon]HIJ11761.1 hypothetical protein [Candidatus Woesearchaeota archaeon]|tara:strand:- start:338 stop:541 length:204 start_codon:yes stop_codon:yes gene_type:complete
MKKIIMVVGVVLLSFLLVSCGEPLAGEAIHQDASDDIPLEEVREQASDIFFVNDEEVDAAEIEVGLG